MNINSENSITNVQILPDSMTLNISHIAFKGHDLDLFLSRHHSVEFKVTFLRFMIESKAEILDLNIVIRSNGIKTVQIVRLKI